MTTIQAFLLALVQGVTEFLPVSSSGHLVLFDNWLGVTGDSISFAIIVHVASALAILLFFAKKLVSLSKKLWLPVIVGTIPMIIVGLLFKDVIEGFFSSPRLISFTLLITAAANAGTHLLLQKGHPTKQDTQAEESEDEITNVSLKQALVVGIAQAIAITPGVSRSGSTVFAALFAGLSRKNAFEFSFLLALPAIGGATVLHLLDELQAADTLLVSFVTVPNLVGFLVSFIASFLSLGLLRFMMKKAQFWWFSVYCILMACISFLV